MEKRGHQSSSIYRQNLSGAYKLFIESDSGKNFVKTLHDKKYRIKDTKLTYRTINHWEQVKLISSKRENGREWREFSFLDLVWLRIISKLRDLNFPIKIIKKIKTSITLDLSGLHYFEFLLFLSINKEMSLCLVSFSDGSAVIVTKKELARSIEGGFIESQFTYVDISEMLSQTPRDPYLSILEKPVLATKEQAKIFDMISKIQEKGDAKISFEIRNKKPVKFEIETMFQGPLKNGDAKEYMDKLKEHLKRVEYGSIFIQKKDGKIACHSVCEKIKLQEEPERLKG